MLRASKIRDKIKRGERRMIIGITGKSGTGKSYLSEYLSKKLHFKHIDIDKLSHKIFDFSESHMFLKTNFGPDIFCKEKIDRKKLGEIAFKNKTKLKKLNMFFKTKIEEELDHIMLFEKNVILDYALLPGLIQFKLCDYKILLKEADQLRYERIFKREGISKEYFDMRDKSLDEYDESKFDIVVQSPTKKDADNIIKTIKEKL